MFKWMPRLDESQISALKSQVQLGQISVIYVETFFKTAVNKEWVAIFSHLVLFYLPLYGLQLGLEPVIKFLNIWYAV